MTEWTDSAREAMERYLAQVEDKVAASGADPREVAEDLRRHVEQELAAANVRIATHEEVRRVLDRIGDVDRAVGTVADQPAAAASSGGGGVQPDAAAAAAPRLRGLSLVLFALFGVFLPLLTLGLELLSGMCASVFFDPIPSIWHVLLVAVVPAANGAVLAGLAARECRYRAALGWLNGIAAAVALSYAIVFLPLTPFACLGVLYFGLGLIPLAPLIALIVALRLRRRLKGLGRTGNDALAPRLWPCILAVVLILFALEMPTTLTLTGIRMAASEDQATRNRGLRLLRHWGDEDVLLRACYGVRKPVMDMITFTYNLLGRDVTAEQAQGVYYRVTGTPYNAVQPPDVHGLRRGALINAADFDFGQGGDAVAARVRGLSLQQSRLDGIVDATGNTAYVEWTLVFRNDSPRQQEARAQIALPPGGVVSRLTLWIDGQEREAAFGPRSKVKDAYKKVVQQRRDPVLVTTAGPDRILVQCFPVPPKGGEMKVRIGITSPLLLESLASGLLRLPFFLEQNFGMNPDGAHAVWIEGSGPLARASSGADMLAETPGPSTYALRGKVSDAQLGAGFAVAVGRPPAITETWAEDVRAKAGNWVHQVIREQPPAAPRRVVVVVDGSRRMAACVEQIAQAVRKCPDKVEMAVLVAADETTELIPLRACDQELRAKLADLKARHFAGGCDNVPTLLKAWDLAAGSADSAIVWFHATQPVQLSDTEALLQRWQRRPGNPILYDFQFGAGPNKVAEALNGLPAARRLPNLGDTGADAARVFEQWAAGRKSWAYERRREEAAAPPPGAKGNAHMVRLWANDEIRRLAASRDEGDQQKAAAMALAYQLVTPVSGAVVLETQQQYTAAGLTPASASSVPEIVPEPAAGALMLIGFIVVLLVHRRRCMHAMVARR